MKIPPFCGTCLFPSLDFIHLFVTLSVQVFLPQLLLYPNPTDPLNGEAAAMLIRQPSLYEEKVRDYVKRYALPEHLGITVVPEGHKSSKGSKKTGRLETDKGKKGKSAAEIGSTVAQGVSMTEADVNSSDKKKTRNEHRVATEEGGADESDLSDDDDDDDDDDGSASEAFLTSDEDDE